MKPLVTIKPLAPPRLLPFCKAIRAASFIILAHCAALTALHANWHRSTIGDDLDKQEDLAPILPAASVAATASVDLSQVQGQPQDNQFQNFSQGNQGGDMQTMIASAIGLEPQTQPMAASLSTTPPENTPEIKAIAAALNYNLDSILKWVTRNIEFEPYYGLKRGARRTAIDRAGNSFDTAALTVALLRASGFTAKYCFVARGLSYQDASNWLGVAPDRVRQYLNNSGNVYYWISGGQLYYFNAFDNGASIAFPHIVVKVQTNVGIIYVDTSVKSYIRGDGADLSAVAQYNSATIFNAAAGSVSSVNVTGGSVSTYTGNKTARLAMRSQLDTYSSNYVTNILASDDKHMFDGRQASRGRWIDPGCSYQLLDVAGVLGEWDDIPDTSDVPFCVKLDVKIGNMPLQQFKTADLGGSKLSIILLNKVAVLCVDDVPVPGAVESGAGDTLPVTITFDYGIDTDGASPAPLSRTGGPYVITYGYASCLGTLKERMRKLAALKEQPDITDTSHQIVSENLYILGLQYLNENNAINEISSSVNPARHYILNQAGIVGMNQAPYVDLPVNTVNIGIRDNGVSDANALTMTDKTLMASINWVSMLEHSLIEQMIISDANPANQYLDAAVSTTKLIQYYVDTGAPVYLPKSTAEWSGLRSSGKLTNYPTALLDTLGGNFTATMRAGGILLPGNYNQKYKQYSGMGYATAFATNATTDDLGATMIITGVYGTLTNGGNTAVPYVFSSDAPTSISNIITLGPTPLALAPSSYSNTLGLYTVNDPVDVSNGALLIDATDLTMGQGAAPYGLAFTRQYSSLLRNSDPAGLGKGWTHNYNIRITHQHAGFLDLARMTLAEAAPIMVATKAIYDTADISKTTSTAKTWVVPALIACWLGDQFINNHATVQMGRDTLDFVKLPCSADATTYTYAPPPGVAATLSGKPATGHTLQFRKGLKITFRGMDGRFTSISDPNNSAADSAKPALKADYSGLPSNYSDDTKRLVKVTDAYGRYFTLSNSGTVLYQVTDSSDQQRTVKYTADSAAFTSTDPDNNATTYTWDTKHRITKITTPPTDLYPQGRVTVTSVYDDYDRVITQYNMGDTARVWTYDYAPGATRYVSPEKNPVTNLRYCSFYYFDAKGRKTTYINENGDQTDWQYDGVDRTTLVVVPWRGWLMTDAQGQQFQWRENTAYTYDKNHELILIRDPAGRQTKTVPTNDANSTPRTDTSPGGQVTTTTYYSGLYLPNTITRPGGITDTFVTYDTWGRLTTYHPAAYDTGKNITYAYTNATRGLAKITTTYPTTPATTEITNYNEIGDPTTTTDRAGVTTTYEYNKRRQPTKITVTAPGQTPQVTKIGYDSSGNKTYVTDPLGHSTDYTYNADGQIETITAPDGALTSYTYDLRGLRTGVINDHNAKTTTYYDPAQRPIATLDTLNGATYYDYDPLGNLLATTTPLGNTTQAHYEDPGRNLVTTTIDANGKEITNAYDDDGRLIGMTNRRDQIYTTTYNDNLRQVDTETPEHKKTSAFANARGLPDTTILPSNKTVKNTAYDPEGRVLTQVTYDTNGATPLATTTMTYDGAGRLYQVTENGKTTTRNYDTLGRLSSYQDGEGNTIAYTYDLANNLKTLTYPGNLTLTYDYDECNRLISVRDWQQRTTTYTYDTLGRLTKTTRPNNTTREQLYDRANRLTMITERKQDGTLLWMRTLAYDADNRITATYTYPTTPFAAPNANDTAGYDNDNRLATWNGAGCNFDPDGNMLAGPNAQGAAASYQYDPHNRLTGINNQPLYTYNPDGHRLLVNGVRYVIDPNAPLSRVLMRGSTYYIWGANGLEYEINGAATKTYHPDHLGSTMLLTDDNGGTIATFEYDSYGNPSPNNSNVTPFRFHGALGCITDDNGLVYMRARYYNPRIMRFLNQDPIGFQGGLNWFAAFDNNPVSNVDPLGLCSGNSSSASALYNPVNFFAYYNQGDSMPLYDGLTKIGTVTVNTYQLDDSVRGYNGVGIELTPSISNTSAQNGVYRWRQYTSIQDQNDNFYQWQGRTYNRLLDPQPPDDNKDWYWTDTEWHDNAVDAYSARFSDGPLTKLSLLNNNVTSLKNTYDLELVHVKSMNESTGGNVVLRLHWGDTVSSGTHTLIPLTIGR